jgi:uncharacterized membrane protein
MSKKKSKKHDNDSEEYHGVMGFLQAYFRQLRRYFITGLLVWVPLIVTAWVAWWVISNVGFGMERMINDAVQSLQQTGESFPKLGFLQYLVYKPGFGFFTAILLFLSTGFITRYIAGRKLIATGEWVLGKIPFVSKIYTASQQIRDVFVGRDGTVFQSVTLVEYPRPGLLVVGFITSTERGIVQQATQRDLTAVFIPTTPNPTSGFLLYVPPNELTPLNITVEDAMKLIVSGGAFLPDTRDNDAVANDE